MKTLFLIWIITPLLMLQVEGSDAFELKYPGIPANSQNAPKGFHDVYTDIELTMKDGNGQIRIYKMEQIRVEETSGRIKKRITVQYPEHLKGTALLIHSRNDGASDQWLYLSARKRVKRVYPCFQAGRFINSQWSHEDMGGRMIEKYTHRWLRDSIVEGRAYSVFEAVPKDKSNSGYMRYLRWIEKETGQVRKIAYYDQRNELLKTLTLDRYQQYADHHWYIREMSMVNHKTGQETRVVFSHYRFNLGPPPACFRKKHFHKIRIPEKVLPPRVKYGPTFRRESAHD